ncbi:MAG: outer membrane protein assembly factor BamD [Motiliproteus sp.]|nr:outer membrane protein assembly factor BamD [Motiliproteus sp.]MCW9052308.1 outer membrane protein assembly factor BamD [Motiliproteus sp.]
MRIVNIILLMTLISLNTGCSFFGIDDEEFFDIPEKQLYDEAMGYIATSEWDLAADKFEQLESRYPFGRFSEQAQLELIYVYFKGSEAPQAIAAADRFIRLHPQHENIDYAYYLRGLTNYEADKSLTSRFLPTDPSQRDPGAARDAFSDFSNLLNRYPSSQYAPDSRKRMLSLKNQLSAYEIHVARYYIKRGAYVAAANRGRYVVENYQQTPSVPDALAVMVLAYTELGLHDQASHAQQILSSNFPDYGKEIDVDKNAERSLLNTATFGLFGEDGEESTKKAPKPKKVEKKKPEPEAKAKAKAKNESEEDRSWFSRITFGVFD